MRVRSSSSTFLRSAACAGVIAALAATAQAAVPSDSFTVTGAVQTPASYDLSALQSLPSQTQTVSYGSGAGPQTHTYTGTSLWGIVERAGFQTQPGVKNDNLNGYVVATGSDGYRAVYALGELNPNFGNRPNLIAYSQIVQGQSVGLGTDGFARVTAPGDVKGGRYVSKLVSLVVHRSASTQTGIGGGLSTQFTVSGDVKATTTFDLSGLQGLHQVTREVNGVSYTGVSFWDLLSGTVGLWLDPAVKNDVLGKYVVATGSDGYKSVFSLGELEPGFGNQPVMIAWSADGGTLGTNGFARLVVPNDVRAGRWVSNLVSLEVFSAASVVPEPSTWALLVAGLGLVGWRARRTRASSDVA